MAARKTVTLRPAKPEDLAAVQDIENSSFTTPWDPGFFREIQEDGMQRLDVLDDEGVITGYIAWWHVADEAHISNVAIAPSYRRLGLGWKMMNIVIDKCRYAGVTRIILEVNEHNEPAILLYNALGFEFIGRRKKYYEDRDDALVLILKL